MGRNLKNAEKSTEPLGAPLNGFFGFHSNFQCYTSQSGSANTTPRATLSALWNTRLNIYQQKKQSWEVEAKKKRKEKKKLSRKERERKEKAL